MTSPHARAVVARLTRYRLAAVAAAALLILATTGVVLAVQPGPVQTYTGCLNRLTGVPYNVRVGTIPLHACLPNDPIASWNNIGPAGADGATGATAATGATGATGAPGLDGAPGTNGASLTAVPLPAGDGRCGAAGGVELVQSNPGPTQIPVGVICNGAQGADGAAVHLFSSPIQQLNLVPGGSMTFQWPCDSGSFTSAVVVNYGGPAAAALMTASHAVAPSAWLARFDNTGDAVLNFAVQIIGLCTGA